MNLSLNEETNDSSLLMENTYIPELPDGSGTLTHTHISSYLLLIYLTLLFRKWKVSCPRFGWNELSGDSIGIGSW